MFNFRNSKNSKKGILALETILSLIVSIFVLFFVFQVFYNAFLKVPTNLKIAEDNAKSIVEFVDYSNKKYSNFNDCYTILKLKNLENYQIEKNKIKYFYIIDSNGVKVLNYDYYSDLTKNKLIVNKDKNFDFKNNNVKLKFDKTNKGNKIKISLYSWSILNGPSNDIKFTNNFADFFILEPKFSKIFFNSNYLKISENQNILYGKVLINNNFKETNGFSLIFKPNQNELFLSNSDFTNTLAKSKNCAIDEFKLNYFSLNGYDSSKVDYINYELFFDYIINNKNQKFIFKWNVNGLTCPNNDCEKYLGVNYNKLSYKDFKNKLIKIYREKFNLPIAGGLKITNINFIGNNLNKKINNNNYYDSKFIFKKYNNKKLIFNKNELNNKDLIEKKLTDVFGDLVFWDFKKYRKNCNLQICNYVGVDGNNVYFYNKDYNSFVSIRDDLFRKNNNKLSYMGEYYNGIINNFDDIQGSFFRKNFDFNIYDVKVSTGIRTIIIRPGKFNTLRNLK